MRIRKITGEMMIPKRSAPFWPVLLRPMSMAEPTIVGIMAMTIGTIRESLEDTISVVPDEIGS